MLNIKKELAPALGMLVAPIVFMGTTLVASAIGEAPEDRHAAHTGGPATPHEVVASGNAEETGPLGAAGFA